MEHGALDRRRTGGTARGGCWRGRAAVATPGRSQRARRGPGGRGAIRRARPGPGARALARRPGGRSRARPRRRGPAPDGESSVVIRRWSGHADRASAGVLAKQLGAGLAVYGTLMAEGRDSVRLSANVLDAARDEVVAEAEAEGWRDTGTARRLLPPCCCCAKWAGAVARSGPVGRTWDPFAARPPRLPAWGAVLPRTEWGLLALDELRASCRAGQRVRHGLLAARRHVGLACRAAGLAHRRLLPPRVPSGRARPRPAAAREPAARLRLPDGIPQTRPPSRTRPWRAVSGACFTPRER